MAHKKLIDRIKIKAILKFKSRIDDIIGVGILILPLLIIYILTKDLSLLLQSIRFLHRTSHPPSLLYPPPPHPHHHYHPQR